MRRRLWLLLGLASIGCGIVGTALPLVPTTPFLLLAAYAFARSSPRLHAWLLAHPRFGPLIEDWHRHRAIHRRAKVAALALIVPIPALTWLLDFPPVVLVAQLAVLVPVALFIASRPQPPR